MIKRMRKSLKNYKIVNGQENKNQATELLGKYENMSEDALYVKLMEEVASKKSSGSFDYNALKIEMDKVRPLLSDKQREKLDHLLRLINN